MKKILVLGRMSNGDKKDQYERSDDTKTTAALIEATIDILKQQNEIIDEEFEVQVPSALAGGMLYPGFMDLLLGCDLVVFNLTNVSANVGYEFATVQALGKPYILVTEDDVVPAYFQPEIGVYGLKISGKWNAEEASHKHVFEMLKDAFSGQTIDEKFSNSQASQYFGGLSISEVSAATGLAAGYFRNSLRRFDRSNGYFNKPCEGRFTKCAGNFEIAKGGVPFEKLSVEKYFAIRPPSGLKKGYLWDHNKMLSEVEKLGFTLLDFFIAKQDDEADFRNFGGYVLAEVENSEVIIPKSLIVIEVPTFLYALQLSPLHAKYLQPGLESAEIKHRTENEGALLARMQARVELSIDDLYRRDSDLPPTSRDFEWINVEELEEKLIQVRDLL